MIAHQTQQALVHLQEYGLKANDVEQCDKDNVCFLCKYQHGGICIREEFKVGGADQKDQSDEPSGTGKENGGRSNRP